MIHEPPVWPKNKLFTHVYGAFSALAIIIGVQRYYFFQKWQKFLLYLFYRFLQKKALSEIFPCIL